MSGAPGAPGASEADAVTDPATVLLQDRQTDRPTSGEELRKDLIP